tara:strand:- start:31781 stop:34150 length:2370 start_codon:yes stop_codon:yes gene_type:complete
MARKKRLAAALVSLGCLQAGSTWALGLGELTLESFLNEPLKARVSLLDIGNLHEDQIRVRLAAEEDFDRLGVDRAYFLTGVTFEVDIDGSGRGVIVLTSEDPVLEPYLDFIVEARWPSGRLLRNYTVLVDPPAFDTRSPVVSATETVAAVEGAPAGTGEKKTGSEAEDTGTRVSTRESGLAPGAMPRRGFNADTAADPAPGARYMIRRDETLWTIAQRARLEGVSVQQTMLEIQRLNPDAFIDGNINRIKAGFIIYLPASSDISEADVEAALAAVRQQNEDWRAGRASAPATAGPALRISSGEEAGPEQAAVAPGQQQSSVNADTLDELQRSERERAELGQRVAALAERLETLERVVELKDAQIASLQQALAAAESGAAVPGGPGPGADPGLAAAEEAVLDPAPTAPAVPTPEPAAAPAPAATPAPPAPADGGSGGWLYIAGGVLLAGLLGLLFWRRRQADADADDAGDTVAVGFTPRPAERKQSREDAFADIQLRDSELDLDEDDSAPAALAAGTSAVAAAPAVTEDENLEPVATGQRGYGERKHDQYASDVEAGDALAEADIYIAYGRYTQAIDLLRKALRSDPGNTAYRLKLLELAIETGDQSEAETQLAELRRSGDSDAIARAEAISASKLSAANPYLEDIEAAAEESEPEPEPEPAPTPAAAPAEDLSGELADLADLGSVDGRDELVPSVDDEPDFLGLEIEDSPVEELDVSAEFDRDRGRSDSSDDDFVFADDGDPLSTKLDLARAYIDMGDDDGARQILEEVVAEGSDEQQQDARELLDRLG